MKTEGHDPINVEMTEKELFNHGLTKREYFAAVAMQGILVNPKDSDGNYLYSDSIAKIAVKQADALINELNK